MDNVSAAVHISDSDAGKSISVGSEHAADSTCQGMQQVRKKLYIRLLLVYLRHWYIVDMAGRRCCLALNAANCARILVI